MRSRFALLATLLVAACSQNESVVGAPAATPPRDATAAMDVADVAPDRASVDAVDVQPDLGPPDARVPGACRGDEDCAGSADGPVCDPGTRRCVGCTAMTNACGAGQYCDTTQRRCLSGCQDDNACGNATGGDAGVSAEGGVAARPQRCNPMTRACVECVVDAHCPAGALCVGNVCVAGCNAGRPCPTGQSCCNGACVDPQANVAHCGGCGQTCTTANAAPACANGTCVVAMCVAPFGDCDRNATNGCEVDTTSALAHCGGCGRACEARPNTTVQCNASRCEYSCATGFADCDGNPANGCEVDTRSSTDHCGACAQRCDPANATARCDMGRCAVAACATDFGDCDGNATNGCEADLRSTLAHCGSCGNGCASTPNTLAVCASRSCQRVCTMGFADCDNDPANGCEVDTRTSNAHCGGCARRCNPMDGSGACVAGSCTVTACAMGRADCDMLAGNGCEVDLASSADHCGSCNARCAPRANAFTRCAAGSCAYTCEANFADCDMAGSNGCETDTRSSVAHCGGCDRACAARANATVGCAAGTCTYACVTGFADCDGNPANGCETDTRTSVGHCGRCANRCALPNATAACTAGVCAVANCAAGLGNCDGNAANGCETELSTSAGHCGRCGAPCPAGQSCYAGVCAATCGDPSPIPSPVAGCFNIAPLGVATAQSTWNGSSLPQFASDTNRCSGWNAGTYPSRYWQIDLREVTSVRGVTLVPAMLPTTAGVTHAIESSVDGANFTAVRTVSQTMTSGQNYPVDFGRDVSARYLRVTTTVSPSWVSWLEVGVFRCP